MAITSASKTIFLVSKNRSILLDTRRALAKEKSLRLVEPRGSAENLLTEIADSQPELILFDYEFQDKSFETLEKITAEHPSCVVIAILPESEKDLSDQAMQSGARDSLTYPYKPGDLAAVIKRVLKNTPGWADSSAAGVDETAKPARTFTVFSPKGGAGTTTLAANLAIALHNILNEAVLLVDGKHLFGHVALYLNVRTGNSILDLINHAHLLDEQLIKQVAVRHTSGIHVLPCPNSITEAQGIRAEDLYKLMQKLQPVFPCIVIDGGNHLDENTVTYMDLSEKILLLLNPDLASLRDVRQFMQIAATLSYPKEKSLLILNLTGRKADVKREEIENLLKMKIFGKIPADDNLALSCINEGIPILIKKPRHPISEAFREIARHLVKEIQNSKISKYA